MKKLLLTTAIAVTVTGAVQAAENTSLAFELGEVIGAEKGCGLTYDQNAIQRFIDQHVDASDMEFASTMKNHA